MIDQEKTCDIYYHRIIRNSARKSFTDVHRIKRVEKNLSIDRITELYEEGQVTFISLINFDKPDENSLLKTL